MLTAVWMHLDSRQRAQAMPIIASLLSPAGLAMVSLRHGPVPKGRVMFDVSADETIRLAQSSGLSLILRLANQSSALPRTDVTWTRLAFSKCDCG